MACIRLALDLRRIGTELAMYWHWIGTGLAMNWCPGGGDWQPLSFGLAECWGSDAGVATETSSVETLRSVPYSALVPRSIAGLSSVSDLRLALNWQMIDGLVEDLFSAIFYNLSTFDWVWYFWQFCRLFYDLYELDSFDTFDNLDIELGDTLVDSHWDGRLVRRFVWDWHRISWFDDGSMDWSDVDFYFWIDDGLADRYRIGIPLAGDLKIGHVSAIDWFVIGRLVQDWHWVGRLSEIGSGSVKILQPGFS